MKNAGNLSAIERKAHTAAILALVEQNYTFSGARWGDNDGGVWITLSVRQGCEGIARQLLSELPAYRDRFSFADVTERLRSLVTDIVRSGSRSKGELLIEKFWTRLENEDERKVCYVPLEGVLLPTSQVSIGKFHLQQMDDVAIDAAIALMEASVENTLGSDDSKEAFKKTERERMRKKLEGTVCLIVSVEADVRKADQTALRDALLLIDLLRFALPVSKNSDVIGVGLKGDARASRYQRYILPLGRSDGRFPSYWNGPMGGLNIDEKFLAIMEALGLMRLIHGLQGQLSHLERAIFRGIHWFAESEIQRTVDFKLVALIIAVESMFELERDPKTRTICEATAVLLADDANTRQAVYRSTRTACFYRGEVVHQGNDAGEYPEITTLRQVVHRLITVVCNRKDEFSTPRDLLDWVGQQGAGLSDQTTQWSQPQSSLGLRPYHRRRTEHGQIEDPL